MKVKKLTDNEFIELIVDKELEIAGADVRYKDIIKMSKEEQEEFRFFEKYSFKTPEQFIEWKNFFFEHIYDWLPKRTSLNQIKKEFAWFNLSWGLVFDFDYKELEKFEKSK